MNLSHHATLWFPNVRAIDTVSSSELPFDFSVARTPRTLPRDPFCRKALEKDKMDHTSHAEYVCSDGATTWIFVVDVILRPEFLNPLDPGRVT